MFRIMAGKGEGATTAPVKVSFSLGLENPSTRYRSLGDESNSKGNLST